MRERILDLGGTLDIHSAVGQGTQLVITLPMVTGEVNHAWNNGADHAAD
jgi:chemotaxis protein histidine kinase CheA